MSLAVDVIGAIGFAWLTILVHESGHVLVARLAGFAADEVRLVIDSWPAHTALRSGSTWHAPDDAGYVEAFLDRRNSSAWAAWFVAGGFLLEVPASLIAVSALQVVAPGAAVVLAWTTAVLSVGYLVADLALSWRSGRPYGDHVALWRLHRALGTLVIVVVLAGKGAGIAIVS